MRFSSHCSGYEPNVFLRGLWNLFAAMATRARSMPLAGGSIDEQQIGNPFWSERARQEARLAVARPRELPPVPDDGSWEGTSDTSRRPVQNASGRGMGESGTSRGRSPKKSRSRTRNEQSGPSSVGTFKTIPSSWVNPRGLRTEGFMGMETPGEDGGPRRSTANDLERELEKTMFEKVQEENETLRLELERMKKVMSASSSGWSEVSGVGEKTPPPPPPPMDGSGFSKGNPKFTPNGTRVPDQPPPVGDLPPWPFPVKVEEYEMIEGGSGWMQLGPTQPQVLREQRNQMQLLSEKTGWLEYQLEGMKKVLENERRRAGAEGRLLSGEYWQSSFQGGATDVPSHQPQSRVLGEVLHGDRAFEHQPQGRVLGEGAHSDRASEHQPQGRVHGGLPQGDLLAGTPSSMWSWK